ncbi:hypothetical protein ARMGADRAFT_158332 [Armillaria gallica]|uniref:Uncharacterized protein n=1 Tax=Armillaria gallica TaxID=47427 RepID=A0A2H3CRC1_ARMGA|nr:hypothetical protein ARMGADRAFT_158332 [Armillaria gallica]
MREEILISLISTAAALGSTLRCRRIPPTSMPSSVIRRAGPRTRRSEQRAAGRRMTTDVSGTLLAISLGLLGSTAARRRAGKVNTGRPVARLDVRTSCVEISNLVGPGVSLLLGC